MDFLNHHNRKVLKQNLEIINENMARAAVRSGRDLSDITLVAVTKTRPSELVRLLPDLGIKVIGENRVQEAREKFPQLEDLPFERHLIGHLQTNKVKLVMPAAALIHSVDRLELGERIAARVPAGEVQPVLVQVSGRRLLKRSGSGGP